MKKKQIWRIFQALKSRILANGWWHNLDSNVPWVRFKIVHSRLGFGLMGDVVKDRHFWKLALSQISRNSLTNEEEFKSNPLGKLTPSTRA